VQQERIPLRFRQGPERRDDPLSTLRIGGHALRIVAVWPGMGIEVERLETLRRAGSPLVDQAIARDGVEPRRESRSRLVTRACRDQFHPDILVQLLGAGPVIALAQQVAEHAAAVARIERIERRRAARLPGQHQCFVRVFGLRLGQQHARVSMEAARARG